MRQLEGRVAVVTGAASGIGRALAERLGAEGMRVVASDVDAAALRETVAELEQRSIPARGVVADVSSADEVQRLAEATLEAFGGVHVLCNNAGVFAGGLCWEAPLSDYEWVWSVNTRGVLHGIRSFVPILLEQGQPAHVVNVASMAAVTSGPLSAAYFMSKHAVLALSESLLHELRMKSAPIGVSVVCPELVATRIAEAQRNRPEHLKRADGPLPPETRSVEAAIRSATRNGVPPATIAARTLEAILEDRFYVLAPKSDPWRIASDRRARDLLLGRNPSMPGPAS